MNRLRILGASTFSNIWLIDRLMCFERITSLTAVDDQPYDYGLILYTKKVIGRI